MTATIPSYVFADLVEPPDVLAAYVATAPDHVTHLTSGTLTPGTFCTGVSRGPWYEAVWDGYFVGVLHGSELYPTRWYVVFRDGHTRNVNDPDATYCVQHGRPVDQWVTAP